MKRLLGWAEEFLLRFLSLWLIYILWLVTNKVQINQGKRPVRWKILSHWSFLIFYIWKIFLIKNLIFIVRTKKIRTIPEMRTSGCLLNCYFCNRSLFMADHNDYDHLFLGWNDHYNFIWMIFLKILIHDDKSWYCSTGSFPLSEIYPFLSCFFAACFLTSAIVFYRFSVVYYTKKKTQNLFQV